MQQKAGNSGADLVILLFSDGNDLGESECSAKFIDAISVAEYEQKPVTIHAVSVAGTQGTNESTLDGLVNNTNGRKFSLTSPNLINDLTQQLQVATDGNTYKAEGIIPASLVGENSELQLTLNDGSILTAPIVLPEPRGSTPLVSQTSAEESSNSDESNEPLTAKLDNFVYNENTKKYLANVRLSSVATVANINLTIWDKSGNTVLKNTFAAEKREQALQFEGNDFDLKANYEMQVSLTDASGNFITTDRDEEVWIVHKFEHGTQQPLTSINNILAVWDASSETLTITPDVTNFVENGKYSVTIDSSESGRAEHTGTYPSIPFEIDYSKFSSAKVTITVKAFDNSDREIASENKQITLDFAPELSLWAKLRKAFSENIWIPILITLLILGTVGWLIYNNNNNRRATATPFLQGILQRSNKKTKSAVVVPPPAASPMARTGIVETPSPKKRIAQNTLYVPESILEEPSNFFEEEDEFVVAPPKPEKTIEKILNITVKSAMTVRYVGETVKATRFPFTIGREGCDLSLGQDKRVSRQHAQISLDNNEFYIADMGSSNGILVNGDPVPPNVESRLYLNPEDEVQLGKDTILVVREI